MVIYDVIVVGAGPAGGIAAYECAKKGLTTLLLEKCSIPREKACGGAVMYRGIKILQGRIPKDVIEQKIYGLRFVFPNQIQSEFISDRMIGITVSRDRFDSYLSDRAVDSGVELFENARVVHASTSEDHASVELHDGHEYKSRFLIGADGVNSVISRSLGLRSQRKDLTLVGLGMESDFHVGYEGVLRATNNNPSVLEIIPDESRISYGWVFPKREKLAIGVAGSGVHMRNLRATFDHFHKKMEARLGVPLKLEKRRTCFLGGDGLHCKNVTNRAILVGDAAGFVDPMMGEGIAYAMQSGIFAADVIEEAMADEKYDETTLSKYQNLCQNEFSANFEMAAWAGSLGTSFAEKILSKANGYRFAADIMAMVARGDIGYSAIPYVILKKLPSELPNIIRHIVYQRTVPPS
ncbi:MAG: geranylgeranyl reductase family protein [Candidatus Thorarchaeota archaeon]|nr:geranylgeranyl reductase family protein [Candidatus Thorarchaeota archaeon]